MTLDLSHLTAPTRELAFQDTKPAFGWFKPHAGSDIRAPASPSRNWSGGLTIRPVLACRACSSTATVAWGSR
jgi:hypothetical protein